MAQADHIKKMFRAFRKGDSDLFIEAAREIIDEESRKHHTVLANELSGILSNGTTVSTAKGWSRLPPPPRDPDRGNPVLDVRRPDRYLHQLVLSDEQRNIVSRILREFRNWDILEANCLRPDHKLLLCGPPGCGKTATAEAISCELGLPLVYVRFDGVVSSLLGQTAQNLRSVFDYVSSDQWVLFFDEFDAVGRSRDDATEHGEIKRVVNTFLQLLDNFNRPTLVIAATNFEEALDPALWRRFDEIIRFNMPSQRAIEVLAQQLLAHSQGKSSVRKLARSLMGASYAEVERVCNDVLKSCALDGRAQWDENDAVEALNRYRYRRSVVSKATLANQPRVDEA